VAAPSLAGFKARLDGAWRSLGWWKGSLRMAGGVELDDLQGPFQPKPFCDSVIMSKSMEISSLAKSDRGPPGQGDVKAQGSGAGSTSSVAAASAEKMPFEGDRLQCLLMLLLFSLAWMRSN